MAVSRPAVLLDKDGTVIEDLPYNVEPARIRLAPGARSGLPALHRAGYALVIATNQSGVARGYCTEDDLRRVERHLARTLAEAGMPLSGFYYCPHLPPPDGVNEFAIDCACRKPLPGLVRRAARELDIDLDGSWFVGDTWMDTAAGRAAGCRTVLIEPRCDVEPPDLAALPPEHRPDLVAPDLLAAARQILASGQPFVARAAVEPVASAARLVRAGRRHGARREGTPAGEPG